MAQTYPERFAAAESHRGAGDPMKMNPNVDAKLPIWIHGWRPCPGYSGRTRYRAARALEAAGQPEVRMTVRVDVGHDVWTLVYECEDLYNRCLRQCRS